MDPEKTTPLDERYAALLGACDELLAVGEEPSVVMSGVVPPDLQERLARDLSCLQLLERTWPSLDFHGIKFG